MKTITLELPDNVTCVGLFVNYRPENDDGKHLITTTNALLDAQKFDTVKIEESGTTYYYNK